MTLALLSTLWAFVKKVFGLFPAKDWLIIAALLGIVGYHLYAVHEARVSGREEAQAECAKKTAAAKAAYDLEVKKIQEQQQQVITRTVIEYRDRVQVVKEKGDAIVQEVEKLVPVGTCELPGGMRVAHDAAASGVLPDDPERAAAAAAPVDPTTYAATVAQNYEVARLNAEQLVALQHLVQSLGAHQ